MRKVYVHKQEKGKVIIQHQLESIMTTSLCAVRNDNQQMF